MPGRAVVCETDTTYCPSGEPNHSGVLWSSVTARPFSCQGRAFVSLVFFVSFVLSPAWTTEFQSRIQVHRARRRDNHLVVDQLEQHLIVQERDQRLLVGQWTSDECRARS